MKIYFKNGGSVDITQEVADAINKQILAGANKWQCFMNQDGKVFLMVNLDEVTFIA